MTELPVTSNARPSNVVRFEQLMYGAVVIEVIAAIVQWGQLMAETPHLLAAGPIAAILNILTDVLFIWLVARRRKSWVRWLILPPVFGIPYGLVAWRSVIPISDAV